MNFTKYLLVLLCSITAACGRANDLPALRAEAEGMVKNYAARFEELNRRAEAIVQRGNAIRVSDPDGQAAGRLFGTAKGRLDAARTRVTGATGDIATAAKDAFELRRVTDNLARELRDAHTEINADFDAVESWLANAETRPQVARAPDPTGAPAVPPPPPADVPPPGNPGQTGAGGTRPTR